MEPEPLTVETESTADERAFLDEQIIAFNFARTGVPFGGFVSCLVRDSAGAIVAGVHGHVWGGCCQIHTLWVHESLRGQGHGTRLLDAAEAEAARRGCDQVILDTHSFQAPDFYRKHGYTLLGTVDGYPHGHQKFYFGKRLTPAP